jgi:hypothetical protein
LGLKIHVTIFGIHFCFGDIEDEQKLFQKHYKAAARHTVDGVNDSHVCGINDYRQAESEARILICSVSFGLLFLLLLHQQSIQFPKGAPQYFTHRRHCLFPLLGVNYDTTN